MYVEAVKLWHADQNKSNREKAEIVTKWHFREPRLQNETFGRKEEKNFRTGSEHSSTIIRVFFFE